jgi:hypothetical protein
MNNKCEKNVPSTDSARKRILRKKCAFGRSEQENEENRNKKEKGKRNSTFSLFRRTRKSSY